MKARKNISLALWVIGLVTTISAQAQYAYSTLDYTNNGTVEPTMLCDFEGKKIVGIYSDSSGDHGFICDTSASPLNWTLLNVPRAISPSALGTDPASISGGNIAGYYTDAQGKDHGFLRDASVNPPSWTKLDALPSAVFTRATGIIYNGTKNLIVGYYSDGSTSHGFLYDSSLPPGSRFTMPLDFPGATGEGTYATGISGNTIVGTYMHGNNYSGFTHTINGTDWNQLDNKPIATDTLLQHISGNQIVGFYWTPDGAAHGVLYNSTAATPWTTIDDPLSTSLFNNSALGVSPNANEIVGYYTANGTGHGFIALKTHTNGPKAAALLTGAKAAPVLQSKQQSKHNGFLPALHRK